MTNCGASGENCCISLGITGGTYYRTYLNTGNGPSGDANLATVSTFQLDKYLVTVGRFQQFIGAWNGGYRPPPGSGKHTHLNAGKGLLDSASPGTYETGWNASFDTIPNLAPCATLLGQAEDLPAAGCVDWYAAYAFCIWDGGFLPSEAEWEYAAAAGDQQREYPWGSADPASTDQYAIYNCEYPPGSNRGCLGLTGAPNVAPVGTATLGAGRWGQLDMAGDVWEWTLDWYAPYIDPCPDCAYLTTGHLDASFQGNSRVSRGGAFNSAASSLLTTSRFPDYPSTVGRPLGFRCARTP